MIEDETLDELLRGRLRVYQPARGARVSLDALFLADFAAPLAGARARVVDLGCGVGVVGLALAAGRGLSVVGVELQPRLAALARRNAELNGVALDVVEADLRDRLPLAAESIDLVVSNPPFHAPTRAARDPERATSRQELTCNVADVAAAARRLLRPRADLALVYPAARLAELLAALAAAGLAPRALRFVHSVAGDPATRVLARATRAYRGGVDVLPPLIVHGADRRAFTPEAARILGD